MMTLPVITVPTPKGNEARYAVRPDTNDAALVGGIVAEDEYDLASLAPLSGWVIDIGAHIGTVCIALAVDHPDISVIAVEAVPENVAVLRDSVALDGLSERITVISAAAGSAGETSIPITYGWSRADNQPDDYMADSRYIGGMVGPNETSTTLACPAISLDRILRDHGILNVALLKIDCEGCEWFFLDNPDIARVSRIIGEMHVGRHGDHARLRALLAGFDVTVDDTQNVALFEAVRR